MTERDLLAMVAAALASSPANTVMVAAASKPGNYLRIVREADELISAVDLYLRDKR